MSADGHGRRQLFLYWRATAAEAADARQAALRLQASLRADHAGLQTTLYLRHDDARGEVTFMESYAMPRAAGSDGLSAHVRQAIVAQGDAALQAWLRSPRHVELFDRCDA